jgi:hypothetical protein
MVGRYYEGLEYDLRARLGVDLGELWRARRWRAINSYVSQLPSDSRLNHLIANDEEYLERVLAARDKDRTPDQETPGPSMAEWSLTNSLLAQLIDAVRTNTEVTKAAAGGTPGNVKPVDRPKTAVDRISNRNRMREHQEMSALLLRNRPNRAGTIQGEHPPSGE